MPIYAEAQERLLTAFPKSSNAPLMRAVQEGIYIADQLFEGESFLNGPIGHDLRGHVRRAGISFQIKRYCERGDLPFITVEEKMPVGRWHWLEIQSTGAIAHVCRTEDDQSFPDETESRQDVRLRLQTDLFAFDPDAKDLGKIIRAIPKLYAWLIFRVGPAQQLSHLCWASPAADVDEYVGHINVLEQVAAAGPKPVTPTAHDPASVVKLKDHIAASLDKAKDSKPGA